MNEFRPLRLSLNAFRPDNLNPKVLILFVVIWVLFYYIKGGWQPLVEARTVLGTQVTIEIKGGQAHEAMFAAWQRIEHIDQVAGPYRYASQYQQLRRGQIHDASDPDLKKILALQAQEQVAYDLVFRRYAINTAIEAIKPFAVRRAHIKASEINLVYKAPGKNSWMEKLNFFKRH